ncbi:MAG TPA: hypothetical protein VHP33_30175 [Polyangiaceae bacterium]|nr:hypothetical protein [Polyangiaceae bacterium]
MKASKLRPYGLSLLALVATASCGDDAADALDVSGKAGSAGSAGVGGLAGSGGSVAGAAGSSAGSSGGTRPQGGRNGSAGASEAGQAGEAGDIGAGGSPEVPAGCGDPTKEGVLVYQDIVAETTWACPVYTLTQPIYVHSTSETQTLLHIKPGVTIRGLKGVEPVKLPGALIITRSGRLDAVGTPEKPITFTTAEPQDKWAPGAWGGLVLLGRASVNVPANFENGGLPAGEVYAEALPKSALGIYGSADGASGGGGAAGAGGGGFAGAPDQADNDGWNCGVLKYARVNFAGFKAGSSKELNGVTIAGCGSETLIDHVQVHRCSDDGIEVFGGSPRLSHIVLTGNQDDQFDWDQGFRGKVQFMAMQVHEDADNADSCGIEADGYATPDAPVGLPSGPRLWNVTVIASKVTQRGIRFRDGTQAFMSNAILAAHTDGVPKGLIDIDHALTADYLASGKLVVQHSIFCGGWPALGQADSKGTTYLEQDYFTGTGAGATGNQVMSAASELWLNAFNQSQPDWVPAATSLAAQGAAVPSDVDGSTFFDATATYRGAFKPGGEDWTAGWTTYP